MTARELVWQVLWWAFVIGILAYLIGGTLIFGVGEGCNERYEECDSAWDRRDAL